jgi:tetratricopeptide (TPR) repeat protein
MSDEIRRLSDELARDPSSLVFVPLGEALRRQGSTDLALKIALRGLERHPYHPDGHDLIARIAVDRGEMERALDEWDMALRLAPEHVGARKGLGFICFQQGRLPEAEEHLAAALTLDPDDQAIASALHRVRKARAESGVRSAESSVPGIERLGLRAESREPRAESREADIPDDPRMLFVDLLGKVDGTTLLLDPEGLVLAGAYLVGAGEDVGQEVGAALSGVSDEAARATRHLGIGTWDSIVFETEYATVSMAPTDGDGLVLLATGRATPLGLARRLLDRCARRAASFLAGARA